MGNPARELHAIYSDWRARLDASHGPMTSVVSPDSDEGVRTLIRASRALVRLDEVLTDLASQGFKVDLYRRQYPEWWKGVLSFKSGWGTTMQGEHVLSALHMDEIEGCANYLDGKVWELTTSHEQSLREVLADARRALEVDGELSVELRRYVSRLLREIQTALDDQAMGATFDYADAVERLLVAFKAAEGEATHARELWVNLRTSILPAAGFAATIEGVSIFAQRALGG